jgi:hypothetical protein
MSTQEQAMPERIWAIANGGIQNWLSRPPIFLSTTEFVRADLVAELVEGLHRAGAAFEVMSREAYRCGIEGSKEWDDIAGNADLYGALDVIRAALAKFSPTTEAEE